MVFHDPLKTPEAGARREIRFWREDVVHLPSAVVLELNERARGSILRLGDNDGESERLQPGANGRITAAEIG